MSIIIKEVNGIKKVYKNKKLLGTVRKFCCGVDFRPKAKNCIFSILKVKIDSKELIFCIDKISSLNIPDCYFHYNFNIDIANSELKLKKYQKSLNNIISPNSD